MSNAQKILADAAVYIAENGWHQGGSFAGESEDIDFNWTEIAATMPAACALGGIYFASNRYPFEDMARARCALAVVIEGTPMPDNLAGTSRASCVVAEFNDRDTTSAEDVLLMMKKAAEL